jgi:hypothetical protein
VHSEQPAEYEKELAKYESALETVRQQRLVMEQLEEMIERNVKVDRLVRDARVGTSKSDEGAAALHDVVQLQAALMALQIKRSAAKRAYFRQLNALELECAELRALANSVLPKEPKLVGLVDPTRSAALPEALFRAPATTS